MHRREFLTYMGLLAAGPAIGSCATVSPRFNKPEPLTLFEEKLLLTNVNIVDVHEGRLREERQVLIQNGRILDLFSEHDQPSLGSYRKLDLGGAYVLPGLINAHCHMTGPCTITYNLDSLLSWRRQVERNAEECIKHGVTTVRDMFGIPGFLHELKNKIAQQEIVGPRIISGYALEVENGYGSSLPFVETVEIRSPEHGREMVRRATDRGHSFIKLFQQPVSLRFPEKELALMDESSMKAISEEAHRLGQVAAIHHSDVSGFEKALSAGVSSFEHMASDELLSEEHLRRFLESGAIILPTVSVRYGLCFKTHENVNVGKGLSGTLMQERQQVIPQMASEYLEPEIGEGLLKAFKKYSNPDYFEKRHLMPTINIPWFARRAGGYTANLKAMYKAGVPMGCGNDGGIPFVFPGAVGLELSILEEMGVDTVDALRMATVNNARLLGMEAEIGSIEKGKIADIAVFEKDPLVTARHTFNPLMVFKEGRLVYRSKTTEDVSPEARI